MLSLGGVKSIGPGPANHWGEQGAAIGPFGQSPEGASIFRAEAMTAGG
jgi:hypothetical protein